jgi:hypothetical protein
MFSARHVWLALLSILIVLLLLLTNPGVVGAGAGAARASATEMQENPCEDFDRNNFSNPTQIDNHCLHMGA